MPTRKKTGKKRTSKAKSTRKSKTVEIPILTRRAPNDTQENDIIAEPSSQISEQELDYNQEIRALVTVAVNESVPQMVDSIMAKLLQPIGTDPNSSN